MVLFRHISGFVFFVIFLACSEVFSAEQEPSLHELACRHVISRLAKVDFEDWQGGRLPAPIPHLFQEPIEDPSSGKIYTIRAGVQVDGRGGVVVPKLYFGFEAQEDSPGGWQPRITLMPRLKDGGPHPLVPQLSHDSQGRWEQPWAISRVLSILLMRSSREDFYFFRVEDRELKELFDQVLDEYLDIHQYLGFQRLADARELAQEKYDPRSTSFFSEQSLDDFNRLFKKPSEDRELQEGLLAALSDARNFASAINFSEWRVRIFIFPSVPGSISPQKNLMAFPYHYAVFLYPVLDD